MRKVLNHVILDPEADFATFHVIKMLKEVEYMLDPTGMLRLAKKKLDAEGLQKLSGFKVEKTIIPLD